MVTFLLILVAVVLVLGLAGMFWAMVNGSLCATLWWCFGGAGHLVELLFKVIAEILKGFGSE